MDENHCYGCGLRMGVAICTPGSQTLSMVYATTSRGEIGFCEPCFQRRNFRDLTPDDVETLTWFFGTAYVEDEPARAIMLLEPILQRWRTPDSLSPLGRAYIGVGRTEDGKALLREALAMSPRHPYADQDREILRGGD